MKKKLIFAVILLACCVVLFLKPKHLTADDLAIQNEISQVRRGAPIIDANNAIQRNDLRLLAFGGYVPDVPGFNVECAQNIEITGNEIYIMKAGPESDAVNTTIKLDRFGFTTQARPYLQNYNKTILQYLSKNTSKWKKYGSCVEALHGNSRNAASANGVRS